MDILSLIRPKKILNPEDQEELKEIERKAFMEEARKIMVKRGMDKAKKELGSG
jgi:hypothetical protein